MPNANQPCIYSRLSAHENTFTMRGVPLTITHYSLIAQLLAPITTREGHLSGKHRLFDSHPRWWPSLQPHSSSLASYVTSAPSISLKNEGEMENLKDFKKEQLALTFRVVAGLLNTLNEQLPIGFVHCCISAPRGQSAWLTSQSYRSMRLLWILLSNDDASEHRADFSFLIGWSLFSHVREQFFLQQWCVNVPHRGICPPTPSMVALITPSRYGIATFALRGTELPLQLNLVVW